MEAYKWSSVNTILSPSNFNFDKESTVFLEILSNGRGEEKACSNIEMWRGAMSSYYILKEWLHMDQLVIWPS